MKQILLKHFIVIGGRLPSSYILDNERDPLGFAVNGTGRT